MNIIQTCSDLINKAKDIVVLTGAGISTASGIEDCTSLKVTPILIFPQHRAKECQ